MKHELDCSMVEKAFKNRGRFNAHKTYVVHDPENDLEGTDLFPEDCDEDCLDDKVDVRDGFSPNQPALMATGPFFDENPESPKVPSGSS